jgi:transposase
MPFVAAPIVLEPEEEVELRRRVAASTCSQRDAKRAEVILLAAEGMPSAQISARVRMHESNVARWRHRFLDKRLEGLADAPRSGRPRRYGHDERVRMAAKACEAVPAGSTVPTWTYQSLADALADDIGVSRSQLWRILDDLDLKPHMVRGWLGRRDDDPLFWQRVQDVCGLYLSPPANALVLSVDEKTSIQAREHKRPLQPAAPRRPARREWEYIRHGVAHLVAALSVHTGEVLADTVTRNNSEQFCGFLADIDRVVDPALEIHLILDNGASHTSKATKAWIATHPRFKVHYTPKHASWLNQIEMFFSILTRKVLRNGSFTSRDDLIDRLMRFIADYDTTAAPFAWTYTGDPLKTHTRGTSARRH